MQFSDQFRSRVISQLCKGIARVFQKLLRYFNGTIISTFFVPLFPVWSVNFILGSNESLVALALVKSAIAPLATAATFLQNCHKIPDVFEELSLYSIKLYIGITTLIYWASSICVLLILLMQVVNGAQFLNITFLSTSFGAPAVPVFETVIVPLTSIYASL